MSPEDTVLRELQWYKEGGQVSDRQWKDVLGVLKVQGDRLDGTYLEQWAEPLGVDDLLQKARNDLEVSPRPPPSRQVMRSGAGFPPERRQDHARASGAFPQAG